MKSKWFHLKETAIELRKTGMSMTVIERKLGIPRSTLSLWFKGIELTELQRTQLIKNSQDGWRKAREKAVEAHRANKALRLLKAKKQAQQTLDQIELTTPTLDLALAMLYFGEGAKGNTPSIGNSDPTILKFVIVILKRNYGLQPSKVRCDLHLRADQDPEVMKQYWSETLNLPLTCFRYVAIDQRTKGKATYSHYKGVCVIYFGSIAIQRKLIYLYNLFCDRVAELDSGT